MKMFWSRKGLTLWSLGSFLQRGRGLPAGPLGLLGLSEGLSYLAAGRPKSLAKVLPKCC